MASKTALGLAISAVLLFLAARNVRFAEIVPLLSNVDLWYLAASVAFSIFAVWLRAWRWRFLIPAHAGISTSNLFNATMIGYMGNNILPLRVGDFARAYIAARRERASATSFFATVVVERLLDVFALLLILAALVFFVALPSWIKTGAMILLGISVLAWLLLLLAKGKGGVLTAWLRRILSFTGARRAAEMTDSFLGGLKGMELGKELIVVAVLSVPLWFDYALATYTAFRAVHLDVPLAASWVVLAFIGIGVSLPSAPGFVGTFQFFTVTALALFSVDEDRAFGFSIVFHLSQYIPITLYGWLLLIRQHMTLSDLTAIPAASGRDAP